MSGERRVLETAWDEVVLESMRVGDRRVFDGFMLEHARLDVVRDELGRMIVGVSTYVRTHNLPPESLAESVTFQSPASWWQHWKRDVAASTWGLRWVVRRWPVRLTTATAVVTVDLRRYRVYPDAPAIGGLAPYRIAVAHHSVDSWITWQ